MSRLFYVDNCDHPRRDYVQAVAHLDGVARLDDIVVLRKSNPAEHPCYLLWPCARDVDVQECAVVELHRSRRYENAMEYFADAVRLADDGQMQLMLCLEPTDRGFCALFGSMRLAWPCVVVSWMSDQRTVCLRGLRCDWRDDAYALLWRGEPGVQDSEVAARLEGDLIEHVSTPARHAVFVCDGPAPTGIRWVYERTASVTPQALIAEARWNVELQVGQTACVVAISDTPIVGRSRCAFPVRFFEALFGSPPVAVSDEEFEFLPSRASDTLQHRMSTTAYMRPKCRYETLLVLALSWPDFAPYALLEIADWLPGMEICPHRRKIALLQGVQRSVRDLRGGVAQIKSPRTE